MTHYYVYYKIAPDQLSRLREAVQTLFRNIEKQSGRKVLPSPCLKFEISHWLVELFLAA